MTRYHLVKVIKLIKWRQSGNFLSGMTKLNYKAFLGRWSFFSVSEHGFFHTFLISLADVWSETSPHWKSTGEEIKEQHDGAGVLHEVRSSQLRPGRLHQLAEESGRRCSLHTGGKRQLPGFIIILNAFSLLKFLMEARSYSDIICNVTTST